jgi:hypothetical protein
MIAAKESQVARLLVILLLAIPIFATAPLQARARKTCTIKPNHNGTDDSPAILAAFKSCGTGGNVVFVNHTYYINSVMNTTGLSDCQIDLYGTLLVSSVSNYARRPKDNSDDSGVQISAIG